MRSCLSARRDERSSSRTFRDDSSLAYFSRRVASYGKGREGEGRGGKGGEGEGKGRKEVALICTVKDTQCDRVLSKTRR